MLHQFPKFSQINKKEQTSVKSCCHENQMYHAGLPAACPTQKITMEVKYVRSSMTIIICPSNKVAVDIKNVLSCHKALPFSYVDLKATSISLLRAFSLLILWTLIFKFLLAVKNDLKIAVLLNFLPPENLQSFEILSKKHICFLVKPICAHF